MKRVTVTKVLDCDVDAFWALFFDADYNKKLYLEGLGFKQFDVLEITDSTRRTRGVPTMKVPGPVAKLLGDSFGFEESGKLDRATNTYRWKMKPNTMVDKLFTEGFVKVEPAGDGKVKRTSEATIEAKIFGVGGLLEGTAEGEMRTSFDKEMDYMSRWIREHKT